MKDDVKRGGKHLVMSNVECASQDCRKINGLNGKGPRKRIKQSVVDRMGTDRPLFCYKCGRSLNNIAARTMAAGK